MYRNILLIAVAGACGTLARYWLSGAVYRIFGSDLPWGTWAVNILGSMLFGFVWVICEERYLISTQTRMIILTGFMGAFTTFSTYVFESSQMVIDGEWLRLAGNLAGQNIIGFAALFLGIFLGRLI